MASDFKKYKEILFREFREYYEKMPYDLSEEQREMDRWLDSLETPYSYEKKALVYEGAARLCRVKVFRSSPFFFELVSGRERNTSQNGYPPGPGLEGWFTRKTQPVLDGFQSWIAPYQDQDLIWGCVFTDMAHHTMGYERILATGLVGVERQAASRLEAETDERKRAFYKSVLTMCTSMKQIGEHFAAEAERLAAKEGNPDFAENLQELARAARRVPYYPAKSFYEALCTILFLKEMAVDLEGVAVAVLGHLDRILNDFYERDIRMGRITYEKAKNYMAHWLAHTDARWDLEGCDFASTNCSITIGGCDAQGRLVWNDVSRMILDCYDEFGFVNPKVQARITNRHPEEYFNRCSEMVAKGENIFSFLNDDVLIESHVRMGKRLEHARLYSAGGCQEPVLDNTEFNSRAFLYISLPQLVNSLWDRKLDAFFQREKTGIVCRQNYKSFEEVYQQYFLRLEAVYRRLVEKVNSYEKQAGEYNPCILISATLEGCVLQGKDMEEGGTLYNSTSIPLVGIATAINSLLAIKEVVFDKQMMTFREFCKLLESNFSSDQRMRDYILNRCPKYGDDSKDTNGFARRFFADAARITSGYENARGGKYEASLFVFYLFDWMKEHVGATPDGRKAGEALSRGMNPTELSGISNVANILSALSTLDLSAYPGTGVVYLEMPVTKEKLECDFIKWTLKGFLHAGGSALDLNLLDAEMLRKAKERPEEYRNIVVRVCGFSAYFTALDPQIQDEIIGRTFING